MSKHSALNTFGRSGNPAFSKGFGVDENITGEVMTLNGTVNKTGMMLMIQLRVDYLLGSTSATCLQLKLF